MNKPTAPVCAVVVTYNRKDSLRKCLNAIRQQTCSPEQLLVINNNSSDGTASMLKTEFPEVKVINLPTNTGGAGGFHEGIRIAAEQDVNWIWLMDDDGIPSGTCLEKLIRGATNYNLDVAGPLVVDIQDETKLCFGLTFKGAYLTDVADFKTLDIVKDHANFFNGILMNRAIIEQVGLPIKQLFIKGDEIEYYQRIKNSGFQLGTLPDALFFHPTGMSYRYPLFSNRFIAMYTGSHFKDYFLYRNMAYINRRYFGLKGAIKDIVKYTYFFIFYRQLDIKGFWFWIKASIDGYKENLDKGLKKYVNG